jgi:hypothetical protein
MTLSSSHPLKCHPRKLVPADVLAIREWSPEGGISQQDLGAKYGISGAMTNRIIRREAWAWVPSREELDAEEEARREVARQRFRDQFKIAQESAGRPLDPVTSEIISGAGVELPDGLWVSASAGYCLITTTEKPDRDLCWHVSHVAFVMRRGTTAADIQAAIAGWARSGHDVAPARQGSH